MTRKHKVTVYIPTRNRHRLVKRAVESVLRQTYSPIEIIVVDDGSSDETGSVLSSFVEKQQITYFKYETPKGACAARNTAINSANGEYITGLDDDDEYLPEHIEKLVNGYSEEFSFVAGSILEKQGEQVIRRYSDRGKIDLNSLLHYNRIGNQVLTHTEYLKSIGGFDAQFPAFQDYDLWVRLVARYGAGLKLGSATYVHNTSHEEQRISDDTDRKLDGLNIFIQKHHHMFSKAHRQSMTLLRAKVKGEILGKIELLRLMNRGNYKFVAAYYIDSYLYTLKKWLDKMRSKIGSA